MNQLSLETITQVHQRIIDLGFEFGPRLIVAVAILAIGILCARWVGRVVGRGLGRLELEPPVRLLLLRALRLVIVLLFAVMALQNLGVQLLPLMAGVGVAGAGVALAMQGVLGNLAAGLTIIFTRPFRVGEYVAVAGVEGCVDSIELFSTKLSHTDRSTVVVPNRKIVGEILHNFGKLRQLDLSVAVAYDTDLDRALGAVADVLRASPRILAEPAPVVGVARVADASIQIAVRPWVSVADYVAAGAEINKALVEKFRAVQVETPISQHEIRLIGEVAA
ncbi:MAG TPA: mechanosensitive ion channel domain-containing protein [Polyangia bacterium]|jgi:small conductance mechanosensitive channel|nr:mechanosensitive ion channel domain-containing protein [Polyangia bacterium]